MLDEIARVAPSEVLLSDERQERFKEIERGIAHDIYAFLPEQAIFTLCEHFGVKSLDGFGCTEMPAAIAAAGAIVHYLKHQLRRKIDHLTSLRCDVAGEHVVLDLATQAHLELVASRGARDTSLLAALDRTVTPMGGRKLRAWILQPLRTLPELERRQQMIEDLLGAPDLLASLRTELKSVRDLERAIGRLSQVSGNARDVVALRTSLGQIPALKRELKKLSERACFGREPERCYILQLIGQLREMPELHTQLTRALVEDPPFTLKDGGIFLDG
ncbi:MAG: DNA mismatch repair protein MutS, partial [Chthoniobacterales bacterium]